VSTPAGELDNSDLETSQLASGGSWISDRGFAGMAYQEFATDYGIPTERGIRVDMRRRSWDLAGELRRQAGPWSGVRVRLAQTDYTHDERVSSGAVGTHFDMEVREARIEAPHRWGPGSSGVMGAQLTDRDSIVTGIEAYLPPYDTRSRALFAFEELPAAPVSFQLGARWEELDNAAPTTSLPARSFSGLSYSVGMEWKPPHAWSVRTSLSRSTRLPTAEELYRNGPHLATFQFEIGDPALREERSSGLDLSLRRSRGRITGELSLFANDFDDYIFLTPTGNTIQVDREEVPEYITLQKDARFRGAEARLHVELRRSGSHRLHLEIQGDTVRAEIDPTGEALPKIPPARAGIGLHYDGARYWVRIEGVHVARQDRVALFETPTDGYSMVHAGAGMRFTTGSALHAITMGLTNLTDELARNHVSPLKSVAPLAGRDIGLSYKVFF
jgi:iron complex outermembrane receptor protein